MSLLTTLSLAGALLLMMAAPGPGVMATIARALSCGLRPTLSMIAGMVLGDLLFLLFAIFGLAMVASLLGELFVLIKLLGGGYLAWLGWQTLRSRRQPLQSTTVSLSHRSQFLSGLLITLGNPKVIIFYCSLLPGFVNLQGLQAGDILLLATIIVTCLSVVMTSYALLASRVRLLLTKPTGNQTVQTAFGTIMISAGALIACRS